MTQKFIKLAREVIRDETTPASAIRLAAMVLANGDTMDNLQAQMVMQSLDAMEEGDHEV